MNNKIKELKKLMYLAIGILLIFHLGFTCKKHYLNREIPILLFHSIGDPSYKSDIWGISKDEFSSILDSLKEKGYRTLTLKELEKTITEGVYPQSPPYCVLTFDDGCISHLNTAVPELAKRSLTGIFFVPFPPVKGIGSQSPDSFLQPDRFIELLKGGDVQSHSRTFETLTKKSGETKADYEKRMKNDIGEYKATLSAITQNSVHSIAYPSGEFDNDVIKSAKKFGYKMAFTTEYGTANHETNPLLIPRYMIMKNDTIDDIHQYLQGNRNYQKAVMLLEIIALLLVITILIRKNYRKPAEAACSLAAES